MSKTLPQRPRNYLSPPYLTGDEKRFVEEAFASNWIAPLGPQVDAFEGEIAQFVGVSHALALSSGTAALHLSMVLLGVGAGDEVLCSSLTFSASANPIAYQGGSPVFLDCDDSWTLDPNLLEDELRRSARSGRRPRALVAVDLYGQTCNFGAIESLCGKFGVPLVEDSAEALGATCGARRAGSFGKLGVLSFNGNKIITTSGGGMLLSNDEKLIRQARFLATQARDAAPHYEHSQIGFNYRLSNLLAAVGRGQLLTLEERVAARRNNFEAYVEGLSDIPGLGFMPEAGWGRPNRWLTCITLDPSRSGANREDVRLALEAENIEARPVWKPMHLQPIFEGCRAVGGAVSQKIFETGLCLPSGSDLTSDDRQRIIETVRNEAGAARR